MRLALRRARGATGLLLAAAGATLVATVALTGLAGYHRDVIASGVRGVLTAATAEERSILVRGAAGRTPDALTQRDTALRAGAADALAGWPGTVEAAGYAAGRQLRGDVGAATADDDGVVYASVMFLDDLAAHADLTAGTWPTAGGAAVQATLAEPVAATLGVGVGDRIPVTDGFTGRVTELTVVGLWRPRAAGDPYWRLAPETATGLQAGTATYGPLTVHRDDFLRHFLANASAGWLITPDVDAATGTADLDRLAATAATARLPAAAGLGDSGTATTGLDDLVERIQRAALVGRSALVTPMLLLAVLGGYTLLLVAALLTEQRRAETALLRARGAARWQVAGLAGREAALVVAPAVLLAPPLATELLRHAGRLPALAEVSLRLQPRLDALTWGAALLVAAGCALAMLGPNLRRGDSYVADLAARSRPGRRGAVQRAGVDVVLVVVALLGWYQLRSYSSPLSGAGGDLAVDPLLAAAPTIGVLAGAVLALRILPPLTHLAQRYVDRTRATAAMLGMWQAGRRPHAGPVLLVALAVAVSALGWSLAGTTGRSLTDQADHRVGADLRLTETVGSPPDGRAGQLTGLPGVTDVLPVWRAPLSLGATGLPGELVAADAGVAARVVRLRPDLADGSPTRAFDRVAGERVDAPHTVLPAGARRLTGRFTGTVTATYATGAGVTAHAVFAEPGGGHRRVPLGVSAGGRPVDFTVDLPTGPARLAGFTVDTTGPAQMVVDWRLLDLRVDDYPVDLGGGGAWQTVDHSGTPRDGATATAAGGTLTARWVRDDDRRGWSGAPVHLAVTRPAAGPVPLLVTPQALAALRLDVGDHTRLFLGAAEVDVRVVGTVDAFPGDTTDATVFADLPSLRDRIFHDRGLTRDVQEWWLSVSADQHDQAVDAAGALTGLDVLDRQAVARDLAGDPFGVGARGALFAAALGAVLLATVGIAVDVSATARRRASELAVLRALGATHRTVTRSLVTEQAFLAGTGVLVGLAVGVAVAATTAPLVILTPSAQRPTPTPTLLIDWPPLLATAVGVLLLAVAATTVAAARLRGHSEAGHLRGGEDR
ncbi:FtsX-like permease family protein [Micromonospora pallida]|uniref:FtsX-like permease family protein n=1 Tax=Micromonospora pallida TaxID=145854 RepID=A0A1C6S5L0_9ACTN|nr:ABC transporter permease [Micromonospora pallida]SCL24754.1 FtsX-like permease family protein [Micromonospora pallida]